MDIVNNIGLYYLGMIVLGALGGAGGILLVYGVSESVEKFVDRFNVELVLTDELD